MATLLQVGVIGIGFGQQVHVPAFRSDTRCQVCALCASTAGRARAVAERLGIPESYGNWRSLVYSPQIDVVAIAVPPALQPAIVLEAARAGKHVFCEKPVATTVADVELMLAAVERAGVTHTVDFLFPELGAWLKLKQLLDDDYAGVLRHAHLTWRMETRAMRLRSEARLSASGAEATDGTPGGWKLSQEEGGGILNGFVSHTLYCLEWLFGEVHDSVCRLDGSGDETETAVEAWLTLGRDLPVSLSVSCDAYLGSGHRLEVYGERGTLVLENAGPDHAAGFRLLAARRPSRRLEPIRLAPEPAVADGRILPVSRLVSRFFDRVQGGAVSLPDLQDGLRIQRRLELLRDSQPAMRSPTS